MLPHNNKQGFGCKIQCDQRSEIEKKNLVCEWFNKQSHHIADNLFIATTFSQIKLKENSITKSLKPLQVLPIVAMYNKDFVSQKCLI